MKRIDALTEEFKTKYEKFIIGCDSLEDVEAWDKEELGEMDVYYENEIISIIVGLIVSDGEIGSKEVEYLNKNFGFEYTAKDIYDIYECCDDEFDDYFDENFENGLSLMRSVNSKLADAYKELLRLICSIILESDGVATDEELEELERMRNLIDN